MNRFPILVVAQGKTAHDIRAAAECVEGVNATTKSNLAEARAVLEADVFDLVVVDLALEGERGIDLILGLRHSLPGVSILAITDRHLREHDRDAIKCGVDGFIVQPVRPEHVHFQIEHVREVRRLRDLALRQAEVRDTGGSFHGIVGTSAEMGRVIRLANLAATSPVPVVIYGESGTGKELVARAIHRVSSRREGPFVPVNLASIPETLLESELFGFVRGAFTGAAAERTGFVEAARGGTLFLDEIGELTPPLQVKILRVLQDKTIHRIGSSRGVHVDFRLISATNRDLAAEVRARRFREDLFYRLHVFPVFLPPLRTRLSDLPLLCEAILRDWGRGHGVRPPALRPGVLEILMAHSWPGNVRELENVLLRLVALKPDGSPIDPADLADILPVRAPDHEPLPTIHDVKPLSQHMRDYVGWVYERTGRNKARTARLLEIDRATLYRKLGGKAHRQVP